jgi:hypothetical protein
MINKPKLMLIGAVTALLAGGSSLALAQTAPTTGGAPPADTYRLPNGAAAYIPLGHHTLYMSAKRSHHKGTLKTSR